MHNTQANTRLGTLAATHQVFNQTPPLENYNPYDGDPALQEAVQREGAGWAEDSIRAHGARCGSAEVIEWGFLANEYKPEFRSHDRTGNRTDYVRYHPAYHQLMRLALESGLHSSPWTDPQAGAHVARAAKYYLQAQIEAGHGCPVTMTFASVAALHRTPAIAAYWLPKILACRYDPRNVSHEDKTTVTIGMGMTEKQGGSDVRANTTSALPLGEEGPAAAYELIGHKWFLSAPMCDAFLMLAQTQVGLSCFLVPRWRPDGSRNPVQIQRLKNKLGNVSNASSEVELRGALGWLVGEEGRGIPAIIGMVAMTRFDCMVGSSAGQRQAVAQAAYHASHRNVFGKKLLKQPLMRNVLADLQLEVEGSLVLTFRMARALDTREQEHEKLLVRLGTAVGKYWICKRTPGHAYEAMECLGGNGVSEDFILARLYREAPVNAIWEGSGNIQALDVLRAISKTPVVVEAWFAEIDNARGQMAELDQAVTRLKDALSNLRDAEYQARWLLEQLALTMQASLLIQAGNSVVAEAFVRSRLGGTGIRNYGSLPTGVDCGAIIARATPLA
ncbi:MAG: isovaleryl-CoA dehydrogenase [Gammaproteobacteria bacterium]|nr:isovaleryl-CoA dehydrogenase [Gammaproteobacteria bacterium]MBU1723780.1 isovaleryl-CoA dehydrogenase [Gammaproteobacteria bacterium]MBU2004850.1 isovaleryl-CoA dehydrogenase [Gammaproteobacteria bacterium]